MSVDNGRAREASHGSDHLSPHVVEAWASDFVRGALPLGAEYTILQTGSATRGTFTAESDYDIKVLIDRDQSLQDETRAREALEAYKVALYQGAEVSNGVRWAERANKCVKLYGTLDGASIDILPAFSLEGGGLMFWTDSGDGMIDYPEAHIAQMREADIATGGNLSATICALKSMKSLYAHQTPSYQIERFMLAVPQEVIEETEIARRLVYAARTLVMQDEQSLIAKVRGERHAIISEEEFADAMMMWREIAT